MPFTKLRYTCSFLTLLSLSGLVGCPASPMCVEAIDTRANSLILDFTKGKNCIPSPSIQSIEVLRESDSTTLWYVEYLGKSSPDFLEGKRLSTFTYGIIPQGFSTTQASPIELHSGETIKVRINGNPNKRNIILKLN
jgi:hypothetical protein